MHARLRAVERLTSAVNPRHGSARRPSFDLLECFGCPAVSLSEPFEDGLMLLRVAEERSLEVKVSKRRDAPYRSGECRDWRKVKGAWREVHRERWRLFEHQ